MIGQCVFLNSAVRMMIIIIGCHVYTKHLCMEQRTYINVINFCFWHKACARYSIINMKHLNYHRCIQLVHREASFSSTWTMRYTLNQLPFMRICRSRSKILIIHKKKQKPNAKYRKRKPQRTGFENFCQFELIFCDLLTSSHLFETNLTFCVYYTDFNQLNVFKLLFVRHVQFDKIWVRFDFAL